MNSRDPTDRQVRDFYQRLNLMADYYQRAALAAGAYRLMKDLDALQEPPRTRRIINLTRERLADLRTWVKEKLPTKKSSSTSAVKVIVIEQGEVSEESEPDNQQEEV